MEDLKEIKRLFAKNTDAPKNEMAAAMRLISRLEELFIEFSKTDRNMIFKKLGDLTHKHEIDELEGNDLEKACELTSMISSIEKIEQQIKSNTFSLIALNYLIKGASRDQIIGELNNENWFFKHEILTRWCWSSAQKKVAEKGYLFNRIYLCEVGPGKGRRNLDREFFTYLKFMPYYQERSQKDYLLYKYNGVETQTSPDFISVNDDGQLGIEVTEARESDYDDFEAQQDECLVSENGYQGDEMEYRTIKAVCRRIKKKISGLQPSVTPCILVIYDNSQLLGTDYKRLIEIANEELEIDTRTYFQETWLIDDQQGVQLK